VLNNVLQVRIMAAVEQSVGFAAMDSMLLRTLEGWFKDQLQRIAASASSSKSSEVEANALYYLALQHLHSGDFVQGETAARKAVDIRVRYNGALHMETLAAKGALAMLLRRARKLEEARSVCVDVVEGRIQSLGAEHFETFTAWSNLASCLYDLRKYDEARPILLKVIAFSKRFYGPSHQNTLMVMNTLALVQEESQNFDDADATYSEIVEESKRNLGLSHPSTLGFLHNYADFLFKRRRHSEAEAMFAQCLDGRLRVLGPQHPATLDTKQSLEFCRSLSSGERSFLGMTDWDAVLKQRSSLPR
jgi:tetratricopeptide (TPR) repeat protein